ncbi:lysophospholipid acyltransferase 7, partial [Huso huso]
MISSGNSAKELGFSEQLKVLTQVVAPPVKQGAALILGLALTVATCGIHTLHSLITVLGTWGIITYSWRFAPSLALSWSFLYLLFFRLVTWFGLPAPTPFTNAVQLLLTLKMVSLANEVQAFHLAKKQEVSSFSKSSVIGHISKVPSLYDVLCYSYCYIGIMTGPFYRYQTYEDWLCQRTPGSIPALTPCVQRLRWVPLYAALFLGVSVVFPLAHVRSEDFLQHHFLYRLFYMVPVFFVFRMRFYAAWCTAEASCIAAGLGAYPEGALSKPGGGPTVEYSPPPDSPVLYDFETVRNIDCYNTDFCVKVRHGMRYWNMSVQWWLHNYIYRNALPIIRHESCLDHVYQCVLARAPCRLLPVLPHNPAVPGCRDLHGARGAEPPLPCGAVLVRLGALVPEDAGLRLHVHGLRAAELGRHAALLGLRVLLHPGGGTAVHSAGAGAGQGKGRGAEGEERGGGEAGREGGGGEGEGRERRRRGRERGGGEEGEERM